MSHSLSRRSMRIRAVLCMLALIFFLYFALCTASTVNPASYKYKSYLLQAQAWLRGELALDQNYEYLELAIYEGKYYVSFPPVPAVPMLLWTLIFGDDVPGGLFQKIYVAIACLLVLSEVQRSKRLNLRESLLWAFSLCFASAMLPITLVGGVWYEAQILSFLFCACAIIAMRRRKCTLACLSYALSVGCRPFTVLLGPALLFMYMQDCRQANIPIKNALRRLLPGLAVGLAVAAAYGVYNYARFGDPFEFGHNYLPEFTRSEHGQLSLSYVAQNWKTLFFGAPFSVDDAGIHINSFGFSMFLSCPLLILNLVWFLNDLLLRRMTPTKIVILLMAACNVFLLLMHRTLGGYQFGARYALELLPLCICYWLISPDRREMRRWECVLMAFGLIFNFFGACLIHI